jgi:membrane-associated protease RseP (regulator of RpoE activity)
VFFFAILLMGIGTPQAQPVIGSVAKCVIPAGQQTQECPANYTPTPAAQANLRAGDRFVSYDGRKVTSYAQLQGLIRESGGRTVPVMVERDGRELRFQVAVTRNQLRDLEDPDKIISAGFLGITPLMERERQGPVAVADYMGELTAHTAGALLRMPEKMVGVWNAAFGDQERDPNGPIGVVGVSRLGGEIAASESPVVEKMAMFIALLGSVNLAIALFNLVPLLPLDGGHMAGALLEAVKKSFARLLGRPDPGYVDVAKALPVTYVMAAVLIVMGGLLIYADLVNPIRFSG